MPAFRIFSIRGDGSPAPEAGPTPNGATPGDQGQPYRHAPFARDPLLVIGQPRKGRAGPQLTRVGSSVRATRLSRWHPLYTGRDDGESMRSFFGPFHDRSECLRLGQPKTRRAQEAAETRIGHHIIPAFDREAWLAAEAEQNVRHPAPGIACRVAALKRLAEDIDRPIRLLARRLRDRPGLIGMLAAAAWMPVRKAKSDRTPPPPAQGILGRICLFLGERLRSSSQSVEGPDTS
jgi:hypothetical protein